MPESLYRSKFDEEVNNQSKTWVKKNGLKDELGAWQNMVISNDDVTCNTDVPIGYATYEVIETKKLNNPEKGATYLHMIKAFKEE